MIGRPRCREWTPLTTQQLRLRSLIQVVGYNIRPPDNCLSPCSYYITLHHATDSCPFYTSERISSPHPKWKEIDSEITQCMSSRNMVIKIWCRIFNFSPNKEKYEDVIIETWGVYFSGLRYIAANLASNFTSECFKSNTLVFQMHGGYFCSYRSLKLDIIPPENEIEYSSVSSSSSGKTDSLKTSNPKMAISYGSPRNSRNISPSNKRMDKEASKSQSPTDRTFKQFPNIRPSPSLNISYAYNRTARVHHKKAEENEIYEHSPSDKCETCDVNACANDASNVDMSETAEDYDLRNQTGISPKYRYLCLNVLKSDIRPSYNADKLLKLHLLQYSTKKKQDSVNEIKDRIYRNSAITEQGWTQNENLMNSKVKFKRKSSKNIFTLYNETLSMSDGRLDEMHKVNEERSVVTNGPRLALKLNDLLNFKTKPSPRQRSQHLKLTKQSEITRFKGILLKDEIKRKLESIKCHKDKYAKLNEENQDIGLELLQNYHTLSRKNESLKELKSKCAILRDHAAKSHTLLANKRSSALEELHRIFYIQQKNDVTWTILDVPVPICGDEVPKSCIPVRDAVGAGFVAQATCLAAYLLHLPLRYKISLLGSASKIQDVNPNLPDPNIPLYARGADSTLFRYGMFLLNKCIAQLLWGRGLPVADLRPTLANLATLLATPLNLSSIWALYGTNNPTDFPCSRTQSLRSLISTDRCNYRQFNRFKDLIDGHPPQTSRRHRHSKSVGSCQDDLEPHSYNTPGTSIIGSEPNIYNIKLSPTIDTSAILKPHNSDSELANEQSTETNKVIFTLGDENPITQLVRMSSNNLDDATAIQENMRHVCSEIEDFCTLNKSAAEEQTRTVEGEAAVPIEQMDCRNCAYNVNGDCDLVCASARVSDVIVIDSAEAILDTGQ